METDKPVVHHDPWKKGKISDWHAVQRTFTVASLNFRHQPIVDVDCVGATRMTEKG